jgi:hypothetical protein
VISKMTKSIGIIAEDQSDVDVITLLLEKYTAKNQFSIKKFIGNGCGKLRNKCGSWAKNLVDSGCHHVVLFHDLDRNDEIILRSTLEEKVPNKQFPTSFIVIPKEELEAWLLADEDAIQKAFTLKKAPKRIADCEGIQSPKEKIGKIVWQIGKKRYLNTVHNKKIAQYIQLENIRRCQSFATFDSYVLSKVFKKNTHTKKVAT